MTEAEWLACMGSGAMLAALCGVAGDRKLRLFACACCRVSPRPHARGCWALDLLMGKA